MEKDSWGNPILEKAMLPPGGTCNWCGSHRMMRDSAWCDCTFVEKYPKPVSDDHFELEVIDMETGEVFEYGNYAKPKNATNRRKLVQLLRELGVTEVDQTLANELSIAAHILPNHDPDWLGVAVKKGGLLSQRVAELRQRYDDRFGRIPFGFARKLKDKWGEKIDPRYSTHDINLAVQLAFIDYRKVDEHQEHLLDVLCSIGTFDHD